MVELDIYILARIHYYCGVNCEKDIIHTQKIKALAYLVLKLITMNYHELENSNALRLRSKKCAS